MFHLHKCANVYLCILRYIRTLNNGIYEYCVKAKQEDVIVIEAKVSLLVFVGAIQFILASV